MRKGIKMSFIMTTLSAGLFVLWLATVRELIKGLSQPDEQSPTRNIDVDYYDLRSSMAALDRASRTSRHCRKGCFR